MNKVIFFVIVIGIGFISKMILAPADLSANEIDPECDAVLFSTESCPYCKQAVALFDDAEVAWCEYDIESDAEAYKLFQELGGRGVPLAVIGEEKFHGFSKAEYNLALSNISFE